MLRGYCLLALCALIALPIVAATNSAPTKPAKPLHIAKGEQVKLTDYVVAGMTTVFDFYSDFCGPCVQMSPSLEKLHQKRDDVVVVKVDINRAGVKGIDWKSPVARQYNLHSIPHFKVYGPNGKLLAEDSSGNAKARALVMDLMK